MMKEGKEAGPPSAELYSVCEGVPVLYPNRPKWSNITCRWRAPALRYRYKERTSSLFSGFVIVEGSGESSGNTGTVND